MNLTERLDKHLHVIREQEDLETLVTKNCKRLGFTPLRHIVGSSKTYIYIGNNYNHEIFYTKSSNNIIYLIYRKDGRSYSEYRNTWKINSNNIKAIFKEIASELDSYE